VGFCLLHLSVMVKEAAWRQEVQQGSRSQLVGSYEAVGASKDPCTFVSWRQQLADAVACCCLQDGTAMQFWCQWRSGCHGLLPASTALVPPHSFGGRGRQRRWSHSCCCQPDVACCTCCACCAERCLLCLLCLLCSPGATLTSKEKLEIAKKLSQLGEPYFVPCGLLVFLTVAGVRFVRGWRLPRS